MKYFSFLASVFFMTFELCAQQAEVKNQGLSFTTGISSTWSGKQTVYCERFFNPNFSIAAGLGLSFRPLKGSEFSKLIDYWYGSSSYYHHNSPNWEGNQDVADNYASLTRRHFKLGPVVGLSLRYYSKDDSGLRFFVNTEVRYVRQNIGAERVAETVNAERQFLVDDLEREYVNSFEGILSVGMRTRIENALLEFYVGSGYRRSNELRQDLGFSEGAFRNGTRTISRDAPFLVLGWRIGFLK